jgi:hypothetical protein
LETKGKFQSEEQLDEARNMPTIEMAATKLSQGEAKQQISQEDKTTEMNSGIEW